MKMIYFTKCLSNGQVEMEIITTIIIKEINSEKEKEKEQTGSAIISDTTDPETRS